MRRDFLDDMCRKREETEMRRMALEARRERSRQRGDYFDCDIVDRKLNRLRNEPDEDY